MTFALARSLLLADAVTAESLAQALLVAASKSTSLVRALLATRAIDPLRLEQQLERGEAPYMRHVAPVMALVQLLPPGLCERLLALPVRRDPRTGTVDVAVVDARDPHPVEEIAHWLRAPVRMVRTSLASMDAALRRMTAKPEQPGMRTLAAPIWVPSPVPAEPPQDLTRTPAYGSPIYKERPAADAEDDSSPTDVFDFPIANPNIPFSLTRKHIPVQIIELGAPAIEKDSRPDAEPVIDLRRTNDPVIDLKRTTEPVIDLKRTTEPVIDLKRTTEPVIDLKRAVDPVLDLKRRKTTDADLAPNAPALPLDDAAATVEAMRAATDRDAILELLVTGTRRVARRVAVFALRRDLLVGWTCSPELGQRPLLRGVRILHDRSTLLTEVLASDKARLAHVPKDAAHAPLLAILTAPLSREVALVAVRVEGKPVGLLLADELGNTLVATRRMEELARAAGEGLARLVRDRRKA
jgi:hypothetical protein